MTTTIDEVRTADNAPAVVPTDADHQKVIDTLRGRCLEVSFTVHGLPKSRRVKGKMADVIAGSVKGTVKGVRGNWTAFTSVHPAVQEFNQAVGELYKLRDSWTIVRSAESRKAGGNAIEGGVRLIWDQDVDEFVELFKFRASVVDSAVAKIQKCMTETMETVDEKGRPKIWASIKDMDRAAAGDCWDPSVYPDDVRLVAGVARERYHDGSPVLDEDGTPKYVIEFSEYRVCEKLSDALKARAVERLDARMSETVETAMGYAVQELTDGMMTFMHELRSKIRIYPLKGHPFARFCSHEAAEVIKTEEKDGKVRLLLSYKSADEDSGEVVTTRQWAGPIPVDEYVSRVRPEKTAEPRKLFPGVVENIVAKLEAFKDRKAKMLGSYGDSVIETFSTLLSELNQHKSVYADSRQAAEKLVGRLKNSPNAKEQLADLISDTVAALEDRVSSVRLAARRRRNIRMSDVEPEED